MPEIRDALSFTEVETTKGTMSTKRFYFFFVLFVFFVAN